MNTRHSSTLLAGIAILTGLLTIAGCTGASATTAATGASPGGFNNADVTFTQHMIEHHRLSVAMAQIAQTHAQDPRVRSLAAQIVAEQAPQITLMTGWLRTWGKPVPSTMPGPMMPTTAGGMPHLATNSPHMPMMGPTATAHMPMMSAQTTPHPPMTGSAMPTMMPHPDPSQLMGMRGAEFDQMFLQMMIAHHEQAVTTAQAELASGANPAAKQLAAQIVTSQSAEITQMRQLLATPQPRHS